MVKLCSPCLISFDFETFENVTTEIFQGITPIAPQLHPNKPASHHAPHSLGTRNAKRSDATFLSEVLE
jgi:hypothetical protein